MFAFAINRFPRLLNRLDGSKLDLSIDALLAVELGEEIKGKVGFIVAERIDFGTPSSVNHHYQTLLKISPFSKDEMRKYARVLQARHLLVHHGGMCTFWFLRQSGAEDRLEWSDAHAHSFTVDLSTFQWMHAFVQQIARKMLKAAHRALADYAKEEHGILDDAAIESLLYWDPPLDGSSKPGVPPLLVPAGDRSTSDEIPF